MKTPRKFNITQIKLLLKICQLLSLCPLYNFESRKCFHQYFHKIYCLFFGVSLFAVTGFSTYKRHQLRYVGYSLTYIYIDLFKQGSILCCVLVTSFNSVSKSKTIETFFGYLKKIEQRTSTKTSKQNFNVINIQIFITILYLVSIICYEIYAWKDILSISVYMVWMTDNILFCLISLLVLYLYNLITFLKHRFEALVRMLLRVENLIHVKEKTVYEKENLFQKNEKLNHENKNQDRTVRYTNLRTNIFEISELFSFCCHVVGLFNKIYGISIVFVGGTVLSSLLSLAELYMRMDYSQTIISFAIISSSLTWLFLYTVS